MSDDFEIHEDDSFDRPPVVTVGERIILQLRRPVSKPAGSDEWEFRHDLNEPSTKTVKSPDECYPLEGEPGAEEYGISPGETPTEANLHVVTVCRDCIDSWYRDYNITLEAESFPPVAGDE